jgi:hypothetical protein
VLFYTQNAHHAKGEVEVDKQYLLTLKESYKRKRNKHKVGSNHYWRYSGKIEAINDILNSPTIAKGEIMKDFEMNIHSLPSAGALERVSGYPSGI